MLVPPCSLLQVSGLSEKLPALLEVIVRRVASFPQDITEQLFKAVVEQQRKNYRNHSIKPKQLVRDVRLSVLQDTFHTGVARHAVVMDCTLQQVLKLTLPRQSSN